MWPPNDSKAGAKNSIIYGLRYLCCLIVTCVCVCVYIIIYIHTYIHTYIQTYICILIHMYTCTYHIPRRSPRFPRLDHHDGGMFRDRLAAGPDLLGTSASRMCPARSGRGSTTKGCHCGWYAKHGKTMGKPWENRRKTMGT